MKAAEIRWVRTYKFYSTEMTDTMYASGRLVTRSWDSTPATVRDFIRNANPTKQMDKYHGAEVIWRQQNRS